ncbi:MAG: HesA/MoeB/ThiF family protein [Eubacteriales bacterium]|nr:HesA/MoeB/ThiF family protein [Eubacteriales bacterium]
MFSERYERQVLLPEVGEAGQRKLLASSALVVGCGGLASTLLYCLCGMGVGRIGFCDGDTVSLSNLNRQFLHGVADIGRNKAASAYEKLSAFAPELTLEPYDVSLTDENARRIISRYDVVLLAVDSIASRRVVNRACIAENIPLIDGGINGLNGTLLTVRPHETACLACLFGEAIPPAGKIPSFSPVVSVLSAMQAQTAANLLLGLPNPTDGRLLLFDGSSLTTDFIPISRRTGCPVCGR